LQNSWKHLLASLVEVLSLVQNISPSVIGYARGREMIGWPLRFSFS
jgi:hypothetical protein